MDETRSTFASRSTPKNRQRWLRCDTPNRAVAVARVSGLQVVVCQRWISSMVSKSTSAAFGDRRVFDFISWYKFIAKWSAERTRLEEEMARR